MYRITFDKTQKSSLSVSFLWHLCKVGHLHASYDGRSRDRTTYLPTVSVSIPAAVSVGIPRHCVDRLNKLKMNINSPSPTTIRQTASLKCRY